MNFFKLFLCGMDGNLWIMVPFTIIVLYFIFKFICALVDEYIAASIEYIVDEYKISDAFAGVTLIALANGAGDVVTAIVASGSADGVAYNVGALFGAGLFVCTIVMTFTISNSRKAKGSDEYAKIIVPPSFIYRDIGFYIIATAFVMVCGAMGKITWWTSAIMLCLYMAFVLTVFLMDRSEQAAKLALEEAKKQLDHHKKTDGDDEAKTDDPPKETKLHLSMGNVMKASLRKKITKEFSFV